MKPQENHKKPQENYIKSQENHIKPQENHKTIENTKNTEEIICALNCDYATRGQVLWAAKNAHFICKIIVKPYSYSTLNM